jgi:hypothetical protein
MDGQGVYRAFEDQEGVQDFVSPSQSSKNPPTRSVQGGVPLYSPMSFSVMASPVAINPQALTYGSGPHSVINGALMTGRPAVPALQHDPLVFDPSTPPPFADRAQMQTPRGHGVLKITNVSFLPICSKDPSVCFLRRVTFSVLCGS